MSYALLSRYPSFSNVLQHHTKLGRFDPDLGLLAVDLVQHGLDPGCVALVQQPGSDQGLQPLFLWDQIAGGAHTVLAQDLGREGQPGQQRFELGVCLGVGQGGEQGLLVRLGPGRIHHATRWLGEAERAFDMLCERTKSRASFGRGYDKHQMIQQYIAESRMELEMAKLLTLRTAWKMDREGATGARVEGCLKRPGDHGHQQRLGHQLLADDLEVELVRAVGDALDDAVQARDITASGEDADPLLLLPE